MNTSSISEIKKELGTLPKEDLLALCLRMARYKKENKELLHYLIFEADDEKRYVEQVKTEVAVLFTDINHSHQYFVKKSLRKILRVLNKHIKYSGNKQTEVDLLIYFCAEIKTSGIKIRKHTVLQNIYERQIARIHKALSTLHEDLQYDYMKEVQELEDF